MSRHKFGSDSSSNRLTKPNKADVTIEATNISRQRFPWSFAFRDSEKISKPKADATRLATELSKIRFERKLHDSDKQETKGIKEANRLYRENRDKGVSSAKADQIRQAALKEVAEKKEQTVRDAAYSVLTGGSPYEVSAHHSGEQSLKRINAKSVESAKHKIEKSQQKIKELEGESTALDAQRAADLKAIARTDAEITDAVTQGVDKTKTGVFYERFEQVKQGVQEDEDFATKIDLAASEKFKKAKRWRTKDIINDSSARTNEQRHDRLKKDFKAVFRATFRDNPDQPANATEKGDIAKALEHPSVKEALKEAQKDVPKAKAERKARNEKVKSAIKDAVYAGMREKMTREETTRRFLHGAEGSVVAHNFVQEIEAATPSHHGDTRLAAARASNSSELHNLRAVHPSGESKIQNFQDKHAMQVTDTPPNTTPIQQHQDAQKALAETRAQKVNELKAMDSTAFAAFAKEHENREKPDETEIAAHKAVMDRINRRYNEPIEQAKKNVEQAINNKAPAADIQAAKDIHARRVANRNNSISYEAQRFPQAAFEHRKAVETANHQRASTKLETYYKAKLEEASQKSDKDLRANLIIEHDTAKAELDRLYPLATIDQKIADIKQLKEDIQTTIDKKAKNDDKHRKLQSDIESFKVKKTVKETDWGAERDKTWNRYLEQEAKTNAIKEEHASAKAESEHYKALLERSKEDANLIEQHIKVNNKKEDQLRLELNTSNLSDAERDRISNNIAAVQELTAALIKREEQALKEIEGHLTNFNNHDLARIQKARELHQAESVLATSNSSYEMSKSRYDSEERKRERHEDYLRGQANRERSFQMLKEIQAANNRAMILAQALGNVSSAIQAHAIGGLTNMITMLQSSAPPSPK